MKYKAYARLFEIHVLVVIFWLPLMIIFFGGLTEQNWVKYVFFAQAVVILLFFLRKGWMAFLRSKFANLDLYAIRCALVGHFLWQWG